MKYLQIEEWWQILAASSLFHALKPKNSKHHNPLLLSLMAIPCLSFNSNSRNAKNNIRNAWDRGHRKNWNDFLIWNDTLSNSITPHKLTNDNRPCNVEEFFTMSFGQNQGSILISNIWRKEYFRTAFKIGNFSDLVKEAFRVNTEAKEHQYHQQIPPTQVPKIELKSLGLGLNHQ